MGHTVPSTVSQLSGWETHSKSYPSGLICEGMDWCVWAPRTAPTACAGLYFQPFLRSTLRRATRLSLLHPVLAEPWRDFLLCQSQE